MRLSVKAISLVAILAMFAFGQSEPSGKEVPALLQDSTGQPMKIDFMLSLAGVNDPGMLFAHFANKPLVIYYFSPKCPHCQASFPEMQSLIKKYEPKGLTGVGISIGGGIKKNDVRLFIDQFNASFPIFQDVNAAFGPAYGTGYVPVVFVVNKDGTFYRFGDLSKKNFEQIDALLGKLFP
jgi:thiol-disulfide isomerase/thioredoxin